MFLLLVFKIRWNSFELLILIKLKFPILLIGGVGNFNKVYTNSDLKVPELAAMLGISAHTLSYLFNQHLKCHYYDYLNDFRIAEFKRLVQQEEYAKYTLSALAELCGFSSRASFFRYFKKATGITPNEYIRSLGK